MHLSSPSRTTLGFAAVLIGVLAATLLPYGMRASALFHMDTERAALYGVPKGFVVLQVPGYDGMQYYEIAKHIPAIATASAETSMPATLAYSYQRILLPFAAFVFSLGQESFLPWAFLLINVAALLGTVWTVQARWRNPVFALALGFCPAAMVGLHFSLAEPLTLLLCTLIVVRRIDDAKVTGWDVLLLSALVLAREVNVLFAGFFLAFLLYRGKWREGALAMIPLMIFVCWHAWIYRMFLSLPFLWSAEKHALPGTAILEILLGEKGFNSLTLSSIALFLGFVLPGIVFTFKTLWHARRWSFVSLGVLAFFGVMLMMPDHIWGSMTSIGRVITPIYPLAILQYAEENTRLSRYLALLVGALGIAAAIGLAMVRHPFILA